MQNSSPQKENSKGHLKQPVPALRRSKSLAGRWWRGDPRERHKPKRGPRIKELVREDVFLMENKKHRFDKNLLANSLTARLKHNISDVNMHPSQMSRLRRESLKDQLHLENLSKQLSSEMNWKSNKLDAEGYQLMRRHNQMVKQSEYQKRNQEKIEAQMNRSRSRTSAVSSNGSLPRLKSAETDDTDGGRCKSGKSETYSVDTFSDFAEVDTEDSSRVKFFKRGGVFVPQNKYSSTNDVIMDPHCVKSSANDYEMLTLNGTQSIVHMPGSRRKNLRVTWSSQSQYIGGEKSDSDSSSISGTRDDFTTPSSTPSVKSVRSDSRLVRKPQYPNKRNKIQTIGLNWKLPPGERPDHPQHVQRHPTFIGHRSAGERSRNVMPVTTAMEREGTSVSKTQWQVQKHTSLSTLDMYKAWLEKLEMLKGKSGEVHITVEPAKSLVIQKVDRASLPVIPQQA